MTLKTIRNNPLLLTDGYNLSHGFLKCNVDFEVSHIYNRTKAGFLYGFNEIVTDLLNTKIEIDMVMEAERLCTKYGVRFPTKLWVDIVDKFKGYIPLKVQALPDGTWCPRGTPLAQVTNVEEGFGEIVTWFEPEFIRCAFASACLTHAWEIAKYLKDNNLPKNRVHSFGFRGHGSLESAYFAGTAWAIFLEGSDDLHILAHTDDGSIKSIPASAHKVVQQFNNEYESYVWAIKQTAKEGYKVIAMPIDTYDPGRFIQRYAVPLAKLARAMGIHIIFRPDSGMVFDQAVTLYRKILDAGLVDNVSVIIGENIDFNKIKEYDGFFGINQAPLSFFNFGMGAGFYKNLNRDTLGFAMKTAFSNGQPRMKFCKGDPIKQSLPNMVNVIDIGGTKVVDFTKDGLYEIPYEMEARSWRPIIKRDNWKAIKERAISQDTLQKEIILSSQVTQMISVLEKKYL